jgi:hypothetical protein
MAQEAIYLRVASGPSRFSLRDALFTCFGRGPEAPLMLAHKMEARVFLLVRRGTAELQQLVASSLYIVLYGWIGHKSSSGFSDLTPSILHGSYF